MFSYEEVLFHLKIVLFCESAFVSPENHTFFRKKMIMLIPKCSDNLSSISISISINYDSKIRINKITINSLTPCFCHGIYVLHILDTPASKYVFRTFTHHILIVFMEYSPNYVSMSSPTFQNMRSAHLMRLP